MVVVVVGPSDLCERIRSLPDPVIVFFLPGVNTSSLCFYFYFLTMSTAGGASISTDQLKARYIGTGHADMSK